MAKKHHLDPLGFGLALGIISGVYLFFISNAAWLLGWGGPLVDIMASWYIGLKPTFFGSIVGAFLGFAEGFLMGFIVAVLYNAFSK